MFQKKDNRALRHNSGGTMTWKLKTQDNPRKVKFRNSILDSKATHEDGNVYEGAMLPDIDDDDVDYDEMTPEEQRIYDIQLKNEWVAENLVDFFHELNMLYNILTLHNIPWSDIMKTPEKLPNKGFPPDVKYLWKLAPDQPPQELSVEDYAQLVLKWIERQVLDERIFPTDGEVMFKIDFIKRHAKKIFQRMFRVFAIMLVNPLLSGIGLKENDETRHIKNLFFRFMCFAWYWKLVADKETNCISEFVLPLREKYQSSKREYYERIHSRTYRDV